MKRSPILAASAIGITSKPSINASKARTGSTSVTITLDPIPFALSATPRPTQPNPATTTLLPANRRFVARMIPSSADCPVPYLLSKRYFVRASLTAMTGNFSRPSFSVSFEDLGRSESSRNSGEHWHIFPCPRQFDAARRREGRILDLTQDLLKMKGPIFQLYIV